MALLKIARIGNPVLLRRAEPVPDPGAPDIRRLAADMIETMEDAGGVGLAAPQVHVPLRLFVYRLPRGREPGSDAAIGLPVVTEAPVVINPRVVINPELEPIGDEIVQRWEGCLSIPGMRAAVPRHARVRYRGVDCDGREVGGEATGFHAIVVQHENDHLDGILYPMRMTDFRLFGYTDELARAGAAERPDPEGDDA